MTHFWWFLSGLVAGALGIIVLGWYLTQRSARALTPRRRELVQAVRRNLDEAIATARRGTDTGVAEAIIARLAVLRAMPVEKVAGSGDGALAWASAIDDVWQLLPDRPALRADLVVAEFNAKTIALTFDLDETADPDDAPSASGGAR